MRNTLSILLMSNLVGCFIDKENSQNEVFTPENGEWEFSIVDVHATGDCGLLGMDTDLEEELFGMYLYQINENVFEIEIEGLFMEAKQTDNSLVAEVIQYEESVIEGAGETEEPTQTSCLGEEDIASCSENNEVYHLDDSEMMEVRMVFAGELSNTNAMNGVMTFSWSQTNHFCQLQVQFDAVKAEYSEEEDIAWEDDCPNNEYD